MGDIGARYGLLTAQLALAWDGSDRDEVLSVRWSSWPSASGWKLFPILSESLTSWVGPAGFPRDLTRCTRAHLEGRMPAAPGFLRRLVTPTVGLENRDGG